MRDAYGNSSLICPFVQILRGTLIGCILLILKDNILLKKNSWLYLWIIFAGLGIVCTTGAAPASIEGIIYSQLLLEFHLKTAPELLVQTLLFSLWVTGDFKLKISEKIKIPIYHNRNFRHRLFSRRYNFGFSFKGRRYDECK